MQDDRYDLGVRTEQEEELIRNALIRCTLKETVNLIRSLKLGKVFVGVVYDPAGEFCSMGYYRDEFKMTFYADTFFKHACHSENGQLLFLADFWVSVIGNELATAYDRAIASSDEWWVAERKAGRQSPDFPVLSRGLAMKIRDGLLINGVHAVGNIMRQLGGPEPSFARRNS